MAQNLYEMIASRNGALAKFFDENHNAARMVKKVIGLIVRIAEEEKVAAPELNYEVFAPRGSSVIVIKLKKAGE